MSDGLSDGASLQGGSPLSGHSHLLSRPLSPLLDADGSVLSFRSGHMTAQSIRSTCTGIHNKVPLLPWYKRDVFAGVLLVAACLCWLMAATGLQQLGPCSIRGFLYETGAPSPFACHCILLGLTRRDCGVVL